MQTLRHDLTLALRQLTKSPGFTLAAVVTLALGIGATSAAYSLLDALFWRPLPGIEQPERLALLYGREGESPPGVASYVDFLDFRRDSRSFSQLAAFKPRSVAIGAGETDLLGTAVMVTGAFFETLGARPALGRFPAPAGGDGAADADAVVLGYDLWQRAFAGAPDVLGRKVLVRGIPVTVVGVAPAGFRPVPLDTSADLYVSMALQPQLMGEDLLASRGWSGIYVVGRLAPGVSLAGAQAEIDSLAARLEREYPTSNKDRGDVLESVESSRISAGARGTVRQVAAVLSAAVLAVLLIACANVAGLLTVRAVRRSGEVAIRSALGAGRRALVRQLLVESLVLALAGALAGLVVASFLLGALARLPVPFPVIGALDWRVVAFTAALAVVCGLLFGLLPALQAARRDLTPLMRTAERPASARLRSGLVVGQVGLSLALLVVASLLLRTVAELRAIPVGFATAGLAVAEVGLAPEAAPGAYQELVTRVRALPGVAAASVTTLLPGDHGEDRVGMRPEGTGGEPSSLLTVVTGPDYFATLGAPLVAGRDLGPGDDATAPLVAVVNESFVRAFWPGREALGRRIALGGDDAALTVVGVAADTRVGVVRHPVEPTVFLSQGQAPWPLTEMHLVVRSALPARALAPELRRAAATVSGWVFQVGSLDERLRGSVSKESTLTGILGAFGLAALALAAIGLYGLMAFAVGERAHEIGVRMALGAGPGRVRRLVVRRGLVLAAAGLALGLGVGVTAAGALGGVLYDVGQLDPASLAGSSLLLLAVAVAACWIPATRAARLDPVTVLRKE